MILEDKILELEGVTELRSKWDHYTHNSIPVPRMSHILKETEFKEYILGYALSLGYKRYKLENEQVLKIGEIVHEMIENFLINGTDMKISNLLPSSMISKINMAYENFKVWYYRMISLGYTITIIAVEYVVTCEWFGGTIDCIMNISRGDYSRTFIVDFKTSKDIYPEYILQTFGYRWAYLLSSSINIDGIGIIRVDKNKPVVEDIFLDYNIPEHCSVLLDIENSFYHMINWYYQKQQLKFVINKTKKEQKGSPIFYEQ